MRVKIYMAYYIQAHDPGVGKKLHEISKICFHTFLC